MEQLAEWSCDQVRADIVKHGDKDQWTARFDGFYLTRGDHSNNSSTTLHDVESDHIAWFTHRTKCGKSSNWAGTSSGAEGDTLDELLRKVKSQGYTVGQIVMNHDTSANAIVCTHFPDIHITYCNNHSAKSFHYKLSLLVVSVRRKDQFEYTVPTGFLFLEAHANYYVTSMIRSGSERIAIAF